MAKYPLKVTLGPKALGCYLEPFGSGVYLTYREQIAEVPEGARLDDIRKRVSSGVLVIVEGSLDDEPVATVEPAIVQEEAPVVAEEVIKCKAVTKSGKPCKNNALPGEEFCSMHKK